MKKRNDKENNLDTEIEEKLGNENIDKEKKDLKKSEKLSKFKIILLISVSVICILIIAVFFLYNLINYKIYRRINDNIENDEIVLEYKYKYLVMWQKNLDTIKNSNKTTKIITSNSTITYNTDKFTKFIKLSKIGIKEENFEYDALKGLSGYTVNIEDNEDKVKEVYLNTANLNLVSNTIDIYAVNNDELILHKKNIAIEDKISFEVLKDSAGQSYDKYILVYVPVNDIVIENENVEMLRKNSLNLNIKVLPENATNSELKIEGYSNEDLAISSDYVVTANKAGDYVLSFSSINEGISKKLNLKVNEIAEKIEIDKDSISLYIGDSSKINAKVVPENAINKEIEFLTSNDSIASVDNEGKIVGKNKGRCEIEIKTKSEPVVKATVNVEVKQKVVYQSAPAPTTPAQSNGSGFTYVQGVLIVNKKYSIPSTYNPGVNGTAYAAYVSLKNAAESAGYSMPLLSGFRSYSTQVGLYNRYVSMYGQATADTFSARPGHSEHQTGLAFDVGSIDDNYGNTAAGKWLANNCHNFGFIIRYPYGKQGITGYQYEPWHIRYLGNPLATNVYNSGLCLEEYLGI